ncbi:unnamed protein product [Rangifer tarandus platyrhynchus]|uniref:Uncharacterized protein n=2 Tax=Rangifer tarandus platyrhynchus TaxID=3082113 RepID=A0ACB0F6F3_RANTA|nr:unnamed protein product [Rangifer tarandus platyrhynchus]CAI9708605.1 unnamed protein product [Rangifer tarandus platyrhynchus]
MAAVDSSIKKKRKFFFFSFQSLNGEGEGAGHAGASPPRGVTTHGPRPAPSTCAGRGGKSRARSDGKGRRRGRLASCRRAAERRGRWAAGRGPGLRDAGTAATFVLTATGRRGFWLRPGLKPGPWAWSRRRQGPPVPRGDSARSRLLLPLPRDQAWPLPLAGYQRCVVASAGYTLPSGPPASGCSGETEAGSGGAGIRTPPRDVRGVARLLSPCSAA